jgi:8-oxo-dGTP diphosphatase
MGGFWEFSGGKIELEETPEEALIRELKEEMDIDLAIDNYFGEIVHSYDTNTIKLIAFQGSIVKGNIKISVHDECRWVNIEELKNFNFASADIYFVEKLMNNR